MAEFTYTPDYEPVKSRSPEIVKVKFGDGYEQRYAKGINNMPQSWSLAFNNREAAEADAIEAFFVARAGVEAFDWTTPDNTPEDIRVKCEKWSKTRVKGNFYTITCTFEEVFEP